MKGSSMVTGIVIVLLALIAFVPFLGAASLFDWDEVNFAEAAREMLLTGEFSYVQINFEPFWEKPPLFIWLQAFSMSLFGINELAARLPNAICGALTLATLFHMGRKLVSARFGLLWMTVFIGSMLPQFYFRSGIIDPWFNLLVFLGIYQLIQATRTSILDRRRLLTSAFFIGLAVLTKGPVALGLVGITSAIYFVSSSRNHQWKGMDVAGYLLVVGTVGFSWFMLEIARGHGYVVQEFIDYHIRLLSEGEAGHGQPFYYHPIVLLAGCFPMSLFLLQSWTRKYEAPDLIQHFRKWMTILFWVVLIVFSLVKTKIIHYSSLTYFPMSFLSAWFIYQVMQKRATFGYVQLSLLVVFSLLIGTAFFLIGNLDLIREPLLSLLEGDPLAHGNFSAHVPDGPLNPFIGPFFLAGCIGSIILLHKRKIKQGIAGLFGTTFLTVWMFMVLIIPKIDTYLQVPLFDFYKEKAGEAYLQPLGFHSYAHLFYGERQPIPDVPEDKLKWMLFKRVDRPVYFISRPQDLEGTLNYFPHLKEVDRKGGYVILVRTDDDYPFSGSL